MTDAISIAKSSMLADLERLNMHAQNTSNGSIPGYRRQIPVAIPFIDRITPSAYDGSVRIAPATDNQPGPIAKTGRVLDLALDGDGYFRILTSAGERYTRRGDFHLDGDGRLVTHSGDPVLGGGGEIRLTSADVVIGNDGQISQGGTIGGRIDLAQFQDTSGLSYEGDGLLSARGPAEPNHSNTRILQGNLENSNVTPLHEMVSMMETSRHFAITKTVLTAYDTVLDVSINTLAQF